MVTLASLKGLLLVGCFSIVPKAKSVGRVRNQRGEPPTLDLNPKQTRPALWRAEIPLHLKFFSWRAHGVTCHCRNRKYLPAWTTFVPLNRRAGWRLPA